MMLVRLIPEQISQLWDMIRHALENSPPLTTEIHYESWINEILTSAMSGQIEVWASYRKDDGARFEGIVLTSFEIDRFIKKRSLLIYYVFTYRDTTRKTWAEGLRTLAKYAKSRKCSRIVAYSNVPEMIEMAKVLGGDTSITFISFELGGQNELVGI